MGTVFGNMNYQDQWHNAYQNYSYCCVYIYLIIYMYVLSCLYFLITCVIFSFVIYLPYLYHNNGNPKFHIHRITNTRTNSKTSTLFIFLAHTQALTHTHRYLWTLKMCLNRLEILHHFVKWYYFVLVSDSAKRSESIFHYIYLYRYVKYHINFFRNGVRPNSKDNYASLYQTFGTTHLNKL